MNLRYAEHPFQFSTQTSLIELTGLRARQIYELVEHLKTVPSSVIYYHTHHFLKQNQFLSPEPPNDIAYWVTQVLQEDRLGEQLAAIDTVRFSSLQSLREAIVGTIERYLARGSSQRTAPEGEEFHFRKARSFVFATPYLARTLPEFTDALQKISLNSLYHHIFAARLRLEKGVNDFSYWLDTELDEKALAKAISKLDPYTQTLEGLRRKITRLLQARLSEEEGSKELSHAP
jgi:hypothetical protein